MQPIASGNMSQKRHVSLAVCLSLFFYIILSMNISKASNIGTSASCISPFPTPVSEPTTALPALPGIILINEILPTSDFQWNCSSSGNQSDAWIELYNPNDQAFDLYAARTFLDTGPDTRLSWAPFGASIAAHGFLVLFPSTDFFLNATVLRIRVGDTIIDSVSYSALARDTSYARQPDGGPTWTVSEEPTIDSSNVPVQPTPTPTKTPKPTSTPKPTKTPTPRTQKGETPVGTRTSKDDATPGPVPLIDGTQPDWQGLAFAATPPARSESPTAIAQTRMPQSTPPQTAEAASDLPHKIFLTLLTVALMAALLWSYQLFATPGRRVKGPD